MATKKKSLLAAAGNAGEALAIEDVFSTYLYTGNGSTQTITNGIDLAGEGGMVWVKSRSAATDHQLFDTQRGATKELISNSTAAEATDVDTLTSFNADGFSLGADATTNTNAATYASWTFRKAPRFFDVVTYTGTGSARTVSHNLGTTVGSIIIKRTDTTSNWAVYHRGNTAAPQTDFLSLNLTNATADDATYWNDTAPTDSVFTVGTNAAVNASGGQYVAYLFAHDPLGPSGDGSDGLIACGSFTTDGSGFGQDVNLGWEPQWLLVKRYDSASGGDWKLVDTMRGYPAYQSGNNATKRLEAEDSAAEATQIYGGILSARGFKIQDNANASYTYIAIRRGPMRQPESGTEVFETVLDRASIANRVNGTIGPVDLTMQAQVPNPLVNYHFTAFSRITGSKYLTTSTTASEGAGSVFFDEQVGVRNAVWFSYGGVAYNFRRAPGFFDVVAYTGTGSARTVDHNLGVVPELMIVKNRDQTDAWAVYYGDNTDYLVLNTTAATADNNTYWNDTSPTASVFTVGTVHNVNASAENYIAYLFATLSGISKCGSYTGNGTSQTIDCGFTSGARFVLIKRTDSTGDWYVWDTARGIVAANDPHLSLNTTAAEVTTDDSVDPDSSGFIVNQVAATNINVSSASYIFYAVS